LGVADDIKKMEEGEKGSGSGSGQNLGLGQVLGLGLGQVSPSLTSKGRLLLNSPWSLTSGLYYKYWKKCVYLLGARVRVIGLGLVEQVPLE
jgi:hypothetical protein